MYDPFIQAKGHRFNSLQTLHTQAKRQNPRKECLENRQNHRRFPAFFQQVNRTFASKSEKLFKYYVWLDDILISERTFPIDDPKYLRNILRAENDRKNST